MQLGNQFGSATFGGGTTLAFKEVKFQLLYVDTTAAATFTAAGQNLGTNTVGIDSGQYLIGDVLRLNSLTASGDQMLTNLVQNGLVGANISFQNINAFHWIALESIAFTAMPGGGPPATGTGVKVWAMLCGRGNVKVRNVSVLTTMRTATPLWNYSPTTNYSRYAMYLAAAAATQQANGQRIIGYTMAASAAMAAGSATLDVAEGTGLSYTLTDCLFNGAPLSI
jgi:hypothetical protein